MVTGAPSPPERIRNRNDLVRRFVRNKGVENLRFAGMAGIVHGLKQRPQVGSKDIAHDDGE